MWRIVNTYIWVAIIVILFLFTLWRMKVEYRRGFHDGATKVLGEWKQYMNEGDEINEQLNR